MIDAASKLVGSTINGKWHVEELISLSASDSTGGFFSVPYRVQEISTGHRAFMKITDVLKALDRYRRDGIGAAEAMARLGTAHLFEASLAKFCVGKRLDRIVKVLDSGDHPVAIAGFGDLDFPYLIFELADGDTHTMRKTLTKIDLCWWMKTLHEVAVGLAQLHGQRIAHQDVKPSNVVFFKDGAKLTDLGRAVRRGVSGPNDGKVGDAFHAPPEALFGYMAGDWDERHLAIDLYHLGSLLYFHFFQASATLALISKLPNTLVPPPFDALLKVQAYRGSFNDALPYLEHGFGEVVMDLQDALPQRLKKQAAEVFIQLCHPNPARRGHPRDHAPVHGRKYSIERYVSLFHRFSVMSEGLTA